MKRLVHLMLISMVIAAFFGSQIALATVPKIIIDSDYNTLGDDGQLVVMAAQLQAEGKLQVLGISVVSGNLWLKQGIAEALKSVERLGVENEIGIYQGANYALSHPFETIKKELALHAQGHGYLGAWKYPEPLTDKDLKAPPDGFATHTKIQNKSAADFIIDSIKKYPHEVSILALGPVTNLVNAIRKDPTIVPLIKQIIYMGGAVDVAGNTTPAAEFNWWFDPEAAQIMVRQPIPQVVIPLDVTNTVLLNKKTYDRIVYNPKKQTIITQLFKQLNGFRSPQSNFENDPKKTTNIWDVLTLAYLMDPTFATHTVQTWLDVETQSGINTGRSVSYPHSPPLGQTLQKIKVVKRFDNERFFDFYVDLLTRPVPVQNLISNSAQQKSNTTID